MPAQPEISVLIPTLNEEANVVDMAQAVDRAMEAAEVSDYELIYIDNGSTDRTVALVRELCAQDRRIRLIVNSRNFGQLRSPAYGIYQTRGRAVIGMCADFQDPPTLLPEFIKLWREGYKIVLGVRQSERNSLFQRMMRHFGYSFLNRFGDYPVIPGATGFGLYDRVVVDTLATWNEPEPFFRAMLVETGFPLKTVPYHRPLRTRGESKNNFKTLTSFVISALATSSKRLLRLPLLLGSGLGIAALLSLPLSLLLAPPGRTLPLLATGLITLGFALTFAFLGVLGEQVRIISERTRGVQLVIEKERVNFEERGAGEPTLQEPTLHA